MNDPQDFDPGPDDDGPEELDYDMNCGWTGRSGDICHNAGSEDCDWDCPYNAGYYRSRTHRAETP